MRAETGGAVGRGPNRDEVAAVLSTAVANFAINRLPRRAYVPASVGAAGILTWFARRSGAGWADMGMDRRRLDQGVRWGLTAAIPIGAAVALGLAVPATRRFFVDERAAGADPRGLLYNILVRIPVGTALAEEIMFRGALLAIFERRRSRPAADAASGVLFGLSHILPTIERLNGTHSDTVGDHRHARTGAVIGVVLATMAAGYGFAWLRDRSGSLAAPVVAHAALNGLSFLATWAVSRRASD